MKQQDLCDALFMLEIGQLDDSALFGRLRSIHAGRVELERATRHVMDEIICRRVRLADRGGRVMSWFIYMLSLSPHLTSFFLWLVRRNIFRGPR